MRALWLHSFVVTLALRIECVCTFALSIKKPQRRSTGDDIRTHMHTNNRNQNVKSPDHEVDANARCVVPQNITLDVLYEDADMLVINKASGMIMQFVPDSVENAVVFHLNSASSQYGSPSWPWKSHDSFEGIVHRIDRETSGILVLAKHPLAARALHASFQERRVHKTYLAIAVGLPTEQTTILQMSAEITPQQVHALVKPKPHLQRLSREISRCRRNVTKALELLNQSPDPDAVCFNAAIGVCKRAGERSKALSTFDSMKERGVTPNTKCFMKAINFCAKEPPLYEKAMELVGYMGACDLPLNPHCVSSAISACGRAGRLEPALELLRLVEGESAGSDGMIGCYNAAISACERCGANDTALALNQTLNDQLRAMSGEELPRENNVTTDTELPVLNNEIVVDAPMGKMGSRRRLMGILPKSQGGREARSIISPVAFDGTLSLNRVVIETGRTHQIRVHMSSVLGCPLAGDQMYNDRDDSVQRAERCMLHAAELAVPHPITGAMLRISCPPPPDFAALADSIRASSPSVQ